MNLYLGNHPDRFRRQLIWKTAGGHINVGQASGSLVNGSFSGVSSNIVIPGNGTTASYLEPGAATNGADSYAPRAPRALARQNKLGKRFA